LKPRHQSAVGAAAEAVGASIQRMAMGACGAGSPDFMAQPASSTVIPAKAGIQDRCLTGFRRAPE
jgi:hypothetical protein